MDDSTVNEANIFNDETAVGMENDGIPFAFKGVTENSSYSDVVRLLGELTYQSEPGYRYINYYDVNQDRTETYTYDQIVISFNDDKYV